MKAFIDVPYVEPQVKSGKIGGSPYLDNARSLQIGAGNTGMRVQAGQGIWLGSKSFADAPFSVDMAGNLIATSGVFGDVLTKTGSDQNLTGGIRVSGSIIVYDTGTPVIIIGTV